MKCKRISVLFLIGCNFLIFSSVNYAQTEKSPNQFKLSEDKKSFPFKEAETIIAEVKFIGLDTEFERDTFAGRAIQVKSFLSALKYERKAFSADEKFNPEKVSATMNFLKQWLAKNGYLKAEIIALGEKLPKNRMNLIFSVKRNSPVLVSEIHFTGNKFISESEYVQVMKDCLGSKNYYDKETYSYCAARYVRELMFSKGFFKGRIWGISPKFISDSHIITIEVKEGIRYLIGDISVKGAKIYSEKEIREIIGIETGNVANGGQLKTGVFEKLKKEYLDNGYILFNAEFDPKYIEPQIEGQDGIVNIAVEIEEGGKFKVGKIEFIGVEKDEIEKMKENFSLKAGENFNQTKLEEGIKEINESFNFYPINVDSPNVEIRTREVKSAKGGLVINSEGKIKRNNDIRNPENEDEVFIFIRLTKIEQ